MNVDDKASEERTYKGPIVMITEYGINPDEYKTFIFADEMKSKKDVHTLRNTVTFRFPVLEGKPSKLLADEIVVGPNEKDIMYAYTKTPEIIPCGNMDYFYVAQVSIDNKANKAALIPYLQNASAEEVYKEHKDNLFSLVPINVDEQMNDTQVKGLIGNYVTIGYATDLWY